MISEILKEGLTTEQEKYISYISTYSDGMALEEKDYLKSGKKENIRVKVKYRDDITSSDLPTENQSLSLKFMVTYIQTDESAKERTVAICKRATELHTEECTQTDDIRYCSGAGYTNDGSKGTTTITYGNLGEFGNLVSGDAFDCDVNGDGIYDSETERFYYVTELDTDSSYGVLIYYNNVISGAPANTTSFAYNTTISSTDYYGPQTAILQLPTTSQWKNVSLSNNLRDIKDEKGTIRVSSFSYEGYAARLLNLQEVEAGCNVTTWKLYNLDRCNYFMENTEYSSDLLKDGFWLETVFSSYSGLARHVYGAGRHSDYTLVTHDSFFCVRPAIEVPKSRIGY